MNRPLARPGCSARLRLGGALSLVLLSSAGCASTGHLAEYDFRDRSVAVVTTAPPRPEVFSGDEVDLDGEGLVGAIVRIGTGIVKEVEAGKVRARLDTATAAVDVSDRMAARVLEQGSRQLRARPVGDARDAEFEIEVRVRRYGIEADDWDAQANFFLEGEVHLLDARTGRRIWKADVDEREPVNRGAWGTSAAMDDLLTASALSQLSVPEIEQALGYLADYCADRVVDKLRRGLDRVAAAG